LSNPIDGTPVAKFSELVFDSNNKWSMELFFPYTEMTAVDSILLKTSTGEAKIILSSSGWNNLFVIDVDSLSATLIINRDGDSIRITTYSTYYNVKSNRDDYLIFGNYPGATVSSITAGFSSICRINSWGIDCLAKISSLGIINNSDSLSATMNGHLYDMNNKPVTHLKPGYYFQLETPLTIYSDGTYSTRVFRRFPTIMKDYLDAIMPNISALSDTTHIQPFDLNDIHPDTVVVQDIHLKSNKYIITSIEENEPLRSEEFTLINYPNPFNLSTNFFVKIPDRMKGKAATINIYDANGQLVRVITVNESTTVSWDGRDKNSCIMPSGIYYYQLNIEKQMMKSGSMILLK
jgi:hypothetical protein